MEQAKEDTRVRITRLHLQKSLIELMQTLPISNISVKMLCAHAGVNRSTFYAHYQNQYDLLNQVQRKAVQGIKDHISGTHFTQQEGTATPVIEKVLEYFRANRALFRVMLGDQSNSIFQQEVQQLVKEKVIEEIHEDKRLDAHTARYLETFAIFGILSMIRAWLEDGCVDEPAAMADLIVKFLFQGIMGAFA